MRPLHIANAWEAFRETVVPADAGEVQVTEMRPSFFAGAITLFQLLLRQLGPGTEPTVDDLRMMDEIDSEMKAYAADLARGAA